MPTSECPAEFLTAALPELRTWPDRPTAADIDPLPNTPAVYLLVDAGGAAIQLATTQSLRRLLSARLVDPQPRAGKADLAAITRGVRWRPVATAFEGRWWYYRLARALYPGRYRHLVSFGPARFLHVDWAEPVPEVRVTERIWCLPGEFIGPWPSYRAAQEALVGLWDLFDLCRHPEQVRQAPRGIRCAYAEMGRCDAPCDGTTPLTAYVARCRAAWAFAAGGVGTWLATATQRMQVAAREQRFELAGQIKQQLTFARHWQSHWAATVRPEAQLNCLLGLPVTRRKAWKLFLFRQGHLEEGPVLPQRRLGADAVTWLREQLAQAPAALDGTVRMEQTWLLSQLLTSRTMDTALLFWLPTLEVPSDLAAGLVERAERVRSARADSGPQSTGGDATP